MNGEVLVPFKYTNANDVKEGMAWVESNGKWGMIDLRAYAVIPDAGKAVIVK